MLYEGLVVYLLKRGLASDEETDFQDDGECDSRLKLWVYQYVCGVEGRLSIEFVVDKHTSDRLEGVTVWNGRLCDEYIT